jgi:hypothetical protein
VAQQGSPPGRLRRRAEDDQRGHGGAGQRPGRSVASERPGWQRNAFGPDDTDADLPSWAGPSTYPARPGAARRRPDSHAGGQVGEAQRDVDSDGTANGAVTEQAAARPATRRQSRAAATRLRKSRRRVYRWCAIAVVVCVIGAVTAVLATSSSPKPQLYVTSLQPGEFKSVPSACSSVSAAVLDQYVPGSRRTTDQFSGATQSECSFTVDAKPVFRLLEVTAQAYQPLAAASGDGSASANAKDNLILTKATLTDPGKKSPLSAAEITPLTGLGQQAFAATQRETVGDIVSNIVTVVVLDRNVLITVELSAQQSSGFISTSTATLRAGATAAAKDVLAKVLTQPTA